MGSGHVAHGSSVVVGDAVVVVVVGVGMGVVGGLGAMHRPRQKKKRKKKLLAVTTPHRLANERKESFLYFIFTLSQLYHP